MESKKAPEIVDISNQSSKEGTRIVLELKKGADVERITNCLLYTSYEAPNLIVKAKEIPPEQYLENLLAEEPNADTEN